MAIPTSSAAALADTSVRSTSHPLQRLASKNDEIDNLASGLDLIASIPDAALVNDATFQKWLSTPAGNELKIRADTIKPSLQRGVGDLADCAAAIGSVALGVAVPAVRLLKIKKLISELGGVWESAKLLVGAGTAAEKGDAAVTALGALVGELSGISGVVKACPKLFK